MASTYSPNLRLELIGTGEQQGTWGTTTNTNLGTLLEEAIGGYVSVTVTDGADTTLTTVNGGADQSRNMTINLTGTLTAARNVICPAIEKLYVVKNATTGGFAVTFKVSGQTGVSVPNGATVLLYVDGTDARTVTGSLASQSASNVSITGGSVSSNNVTITGGSISNVTGVVLNPASVVQGDILYYSGSAWARLAAGTSGQYLKTNGANANPQWSGVTGEYYSQNTAPSNASNTAVWYTGLENNVYIYANNQWWGVGVYGTGPNTDRGFFAGGYTGPSTIVSTVDFINISTTGNASTSGSLTVARAYLAGCSSATKAVFGGGETGGYANVIDYITIATSGNAIDFGDLTVARRELAACSSGTRGVFGGGYNAINTIDYITIATTGNAIDFGDLTVGRYGLASCSNGTRGVFGGGYYTTNTIDYITIATTGNATDFGDLNVANYYLAACSNGPRGVFGGGVQGGNVIDYITIATTGNATDFGDLTVARYGLASCSSGTRGVFGGGYNISTSAAANIIDYITIATTGNATDFGDLATARYGIAAASGFYGA